MVPAMATHLRAYDADKNELGLLPDWSDLKQQVQLNDHGVLTFNYLTNGVRAGWLDRDVIYLALVEDDVVGSERYVLDDDADNPAAPSPDGFTADYTARGVLAIFEQAVVYPGAHTPGGSLSGLRAKDSFKDKTPGAIFKELIEKAKARGAIQPIGFNFTATHDSDGRAWPRTETITYDAGADYLSLLRSGVSAGWFDLRMNGFTLELYVPETKLAVDRPNVIIRTAQQAQSAPRKRSRRGIITTMLGVGAEKNVVEASDAGATARYGRREGVASDARMVESGSLMALTQHELKLHRSAQEGFTIALAGTLPSGEPAPRPFKNFDVGDKIRWNGRRLSPTALEPLRVRSVSRAWADADAVTVTEVELNDQFVERAIRLERKITGLTGGSVTPNAPSPADPPEKDTTTPQAPTGVQIVPTLYAVGSGWRVSVEVTWTGVVANTDGTEYIDHDTYQTAYRVNGGSFTNATNADGAETFISDLPAGATLTVRVRARDTAGHRSAWATAGPVELPADDEPPSIPSKPVLTQKLSVITVKWDGLTALGGPMEPDFRCVEVAMGATSTPTLLVQKMTEQGQFVVPDQPYNQEVFFRFRAVDTSGNESDWSEFAAITPVPLVDADLIGTTITEAVASANETANAALASADGKNTIYYADVEPAGTDHEVGDTWYDTANGHRMWRWNGVDWLPAAFDSAALSTSVTDAISQAGTDAASALALGNQVVVASTDNLVSDPAFDTLGTSATDWEALGLNEFRDAAGGYAGAAAWGITLDGGTHTLAQSSLRWRSAAPGSAYRLGMWVQNVGAAIPANTISCYLEYRLAAGGTATGPVVMHPEIPENAWTYVTAPIGTTTTAHDAVRVVLQVAGAAGATGTVRISRPSLTRAMDASLVVDGAITAAKLAAGSIAADSAAITSLDAAKITVGTLDTARLQARSITADKLTLMATDNICEDPDFSMPGTVWTSPTSYRAYQTTGGRAGGSCLVLIGDGAAHTTSYANGRTRVAAGQRYRAGCYLYAETAIPAGAFFLWIGLNNAAGVGTQSAGVVNPEMTAGQRIHIVTPVGTTLEDTYSIRPILQANASLAAGMRVRVDGVSLTRAMDATLVVDGAITTAKLNALAVTTDKLAANAVTADKVSAGAITAEHITADAITSKHTITGATVQTHSSPTTGTKMNSAGIQILSGGSFTAEDPSTGGAVQISPQLFFDRPGIKLDTGSSGQLQPTIASHGPGNTAGYPENSLIMFGHESTINSSGRGELWLQADSTWRLVTARGPNRYTSIESLPGNILHMRGRLPNNQYGDGAATFVIHNTATTTTQNGTFAFTYGAPTPVGDRMQFVQVRGNDPSVTTCVANRTSSGFEVDFERNRTTTISFMTMVPIG